MQISSFASPSSSSYWIKAADRRIPSRWKSAITRNPSVCRENAKTTSGILSALTAWCEWILSFAQDGKRAGAQQGAFTLLRAVIKYAYEQGIRSKCLTEKN